MVSLKKENLKHELFFKRYIKGKYNSLKYWYNRKHDGMQHRVGNSHVFHDRRSKKQKPSTVHEWQKQLIVKELGTTKESKPNHGYNNEVPNFF